MRENQSPAVPGGRNARLLRWAIFLLWPCTIDRPELTGGGASTELLRLIYRADTPYNLFPSFHVIFSYFCWRGIMGCRKIPLWYRRLNFLCLGLACLSILFVKQHVAADIPSALAVSEAAILASRRLRPERVFAAVEKRIGKNKE